MSSLYVVLGVTLALSVGCVVADWDNKYDGDLYKVCPTNQTIYRVKSEHSTYHLDRLYEWFCHPDPHFKDGYGDCYWDKKANDYRAYLDFSCRPGYALAGVTCNHHNELEDRQWSFYCCTPYTIGCDSQTDSVSDFINENHRDMDYTAEKTVVGVQGSFSHYYQDRKFKVKTATLCY